jgi:hypothetical protein
VRAYNFLKEDRRNEAHQLLKEEEHWLGDEMRRKRSIS